MVMHIENHQQFTDEVLNYDGVVLIDFYADWCGPCRMLAPMVEELAEDFAGKNVKIVKINVDHNQETPAAYNVMSIPTVYIFNKGKTEWPIVGVSPKTVYSEKISSYL